MFLVPLLTWQGGRSVSAAALSCPLDNPYRWDEESRISAHNITVNTSRDTLCTTNLLCCVKQSHVCFLIRLITVDMWLGAAHWWDQRVALSDSGGYSVRSFWANVSDGTTQLCIISVMWTSWDPLALETFPSESATKTQQHVSHRGKRQQEKLCCGVA